MDLNGADDVVVDEPSVYLVALYAVLSFSCAMLMVLVLYVACARKYRLNWFEKNLLEVADTSSLTYSREALVGLHDKQTNKPSCTTTSATSTPMDYDSRFWVPHNQQRQNAFVQKDVDVDVDLEEAEDADEGIVVERGGRDVGERAASPTSSTASNGSPLQRMSSSSTMTVVPIAGNDRVMLMNASGGGASMVKPARIATMQSKLDHTKIDSALYRKNMNGAQEDVEIGDGEEEEDGARGFLHVTLTYDPIAGILTVRLIEAQHLPAKDFTGTADPYAKIRLLPDKTNVWQTRIHKRTLNPVFDEDFVFEASASTIGRHVLEVTLYDFDAYSRHRGIGTVQFPLCNVDLSDRIDLRKRLSPLTDHDAKIDLGELMVSLSYLPSAERLTVVVVKARNLRIVDDTRNSSDPFVKISLLQGTKRTKKRKTSVHRNTNAPVFNEAFTYDVDKDSLKRSCLEFHVMHDSLLGASELLGVCRIGRTKECTDAERSFFEETVLAHHSKTTSTAKWLVLSDPRTPP